MAEAVHIIIGMGEGVVRQIKQVGYNEWEDEHGQTYDAITEGPRTLKMSDGYHYQFESSGGGFLEKIINTNKPDHPSVDIDFESSGRINYMYDGSDRRLTFTYSANNVCSNITYWGTGSTSLYSLEFVYTTTTGGSTLKIIYPDNAYISYVMDHLGRITKIIDIDGRYYWYEYAGSSKKVTVVEEYSADGSRGKKFTMEYDRQSSTYKAYDLNDQVIDQSVVVQRFGIRVSSRLLPMEAKIWFVLVMRIGI